VLKTWCNGEKFIQNFGLSGATWATFALELKTLSKLSGNLSFKRKQQVELFTYSPGREKGRETASSGQSWREQAEEEQFPPDIMASKGKRPTVESLNTIIRDLQTKMNDMESRISTMEDENDEYKKKLRYMEEDNKELKEKLKKMDKQAAITEKKVEQRVEEKMAARMEKNSGISAKQVADIQDRRMNLVFRGILEGSQKDPAERRKHDEEQATKVAENAGIPKEAFKNALITSRRLGKRDDTKECSYRPLLVKLSSQDVREKAVRSNRRLRNLNQFNKSQGEETRFRIDPDLTNEQRDNLSRLWELAKEKTNKAKNGERFYVWGMENPTLRSTSE